MTRALMSVEHSVVRRQQWCGKLDQRKLCSGSNIHTEIGTNPKNHAVVLEEESCFFLETNSEYQVKHIVGKHNQEADHLANMGAGRMVTVEKERTMKNWKAVRGFWEGRTKSYGESRCGNVIKGVDRDKRITISKVAVPLEACADRSAEATVVSILAEVFLKRPSKDRQYLCWWIKYW